MHCVLYAIIFGVLSFYVTALRYDPAYLAYNLNQNQDGVHPTEYWGEWDNHIYHPSPSNWRFPFYTITLDRFADGDPSNNEANGTVFEHNWTTNQFRFGGDARGLMGSLDYIQGMGVKALYLAGSPFINMPWSGDGYGPLDFTLLDAHHGVIDDWRALITEIHRRGMYIILDNTMATMGDLIGFQGSLNHTAPFKWSEYDYVWKGDRVYHDFTPGNSENISCQYPRMYGEDGYLIGPEIKDNMVGCRESEFDQESVPLKNISQELTTFQYGDMSGVGAVPSWQSQLSKFASVQDRLRAWRDDVRDKIKVMSCIQIAMLDIDGFRMDKALQTTVDAQADFSDYMRTCARQHSKENFLIVGEAVGEIPFSSIYFGRGRSPTQKVMNVTESMLTTNETDPANYVREFAKGGALDGASFHYPTYGAMTRFLGLDGPIGFEGVDFVDHWTKLLQTDDMVNSNTGLFDPRHLFGMTNQDVFRWPSLTNGTQRQLLGLFITTLELPGIPLTLWGEEQEFYVLENLASDYVFGRTPMASQRAWQLHGCYQLGDEQYVDMPFNGSNVACYDDSVSLDHRDPSHPVRNILKRMYELRCEYPTLNDGYELRTLSSQIYNVWLPGSGNIPSPHGIWSIYRGRAAGVQDFAGHSQGNQGVWQIYHNENRTINYTFDCSNSSTALISAFPFNTTVKSLFYPYEEYTLDASTITMGIENSPELNGCLPKLTLEPWGYKAFVPKSVWTDPAPTITRVIPSHDSRIQSPVAPGQQATVSIEIRFSRLMDCDSVRDSLIIESTTQDGTTAQLNQSSIDCLGLHEDEPWMQGQVSSEWTFKADLVNVSDGVHTFTINNATSQDQKSSTNAVDRFMFRIGQADNPIVFPLSANYTKGVLQKDEATHSLYVVPKAPGADKWRYSLNWGTSWSDWMDYSDDNTTIDSQPWSGTKAQEWTGDHVILNYWSAMTGSSEHIQHSDLGRDNEPPRRWPHVFIQGSFNQYGYDNGLPNTMAQDPDGLWNFYLMAEWPTEMIVNIWGMNPDGSPDKSKAYGDVDGDHVLDWLAPNSLNMNVVNVSNAPPMPYTGFKIVINDGNLNYQIEPTGSAWAQLAVGIALSVIPLFTGVAAVVLFKKSFYHVKFNKVGVMQEKTTCNLPSMTKKLKSILPFDQPAKTEDDLQEVSGALAVDAGAAPRRSVLLATMEYEIEDWNIKVKIGGLGVMASLMAKNLTHQDLIWVVPCVGDNEYPVDEPGEVMSVSILGTTFEVEVQYHTFRNITFVLLDAPIFRKQTKTEPYPARMDDLESAILYSAWNSCIAQAMSRFHVDIYHVNDYHGTIAPLYLLPRTISICVSLHNAEFQGLWPMRTLEETDELCRVFNLSEDIIRKYVQFGDVFNLLHAAASYLRIHQRGFGAVGVSKKYGKRSLARYPIFWGLNSIGALPNPDPSDTGEWNSKIAKLELKALAVDEEAENRRGDLRRQTQEWAGLSVDPTAELFVFVGRWSQQKGVDLIADVFFSIMEENSKVQLICIGPVIDLYGKFAALKLAKLMERYPTRVFSKPEFTALPPYIFGGAEFALIPSRDEPFGLVAVEFGRKGALGVGARVGGLGQMPGWWFTIESTTTDHMLVQFKRAIRNALDSKQDVRAMLRARSSIQRFPVAQWIEDLETLQSRSIEAHTKHCTSLSNFIRASFSASKTTTAANSPVRTAPNSSFPSRVPSRVETPTHSCLRTRVNDSINSPAHSPVQSRAPSPIQDETSIHHTNSFSRRSNRVRKGHSSKGSSGDSSFASLQEALEVSLQQPLPNQTIPENEESSPVSVTFPRGFLASDSDDPDAVQAIAHPDAIHPAHVNFWDRNLGRTATSTPAASRPITPPPEEARPAYHSRSLSEWSISKSVLSLQTIVGEQIDFNLQKVDPFFTDPTGSYYYNFERSLDYVNAKNSEGRYCIEKYLVKSEKNWFAQRHNARLGKSAVSSPTTSIFKLPRVLVRSTSGSEEVDSDGRENDSDTALGQFDLGHDFVPFTGLKKFLQLKIGDWQIYSLLLALGQIIAANSYQINLITGENGEAALKLYVVATIYLVSSAVWWLVYRTFKAKYVLSVPFVFYGLAFFLLGTVPYTSHFFARGWIQNVATGCYAIASASGSLFFALNFGSESGAPVRTWAFRACAIQGTQQIYVVALWYWGSRLTSFSTSGGSTSSLITSTPIVTAITLPIALLLWSVGLILFFGLPKFYTQIPGQVPSFYSALLRRKVVLWFFVMAILQNYWLSAPYGRNWRYLFSSAHAPAYVIFLIVVVFFIFIWAVLLGILGFLAKHHSWVIPIFAIGLGAPRWCQMLWGTSNIGLYIPWAGATWGAIIGRCLWSWLGVLDAIQGVGFGMILLYTLARVHITATLVAAQIIGSVATILARATAPNSIGPGNVFPDLTVNWLGKMGQWEFWGGFLFQIVICVGFFAFFRKEQLSKP